MKLIKKNLSVLFAFLIIGILMGSLAWEVLERIASVIIRTEVTSFSIKEPIQLFDIYVLSLSFRANPGTLLGLIISIVVFIKVK